MRKPEFVYVTYIATTPEWLWKALTRGELTKQYWYDRRLESEWAVGAPVVHDELPDWESADGYREGWAPILSALETLLETAAPLRRNRVLAERARRPEGSAG